MNKIHIAKYLNRLKNPAVVMGLAGYVVIILNSLGLKIDNDTVYNLVNAGSNILILLGIMNNPDETGYDMPCLKKQAEAEAEAENSNK